MNDNNLENNEQEAIDELFEDFSDDTVTDNSEETNEDFESFDNDSDFSIETPIEINELENEEKNNKNGGLKTFIIILCIFLSLSIAACGGYILGSKSNKSVINGMQLQTKPDTENIMTTEEVYNFVNPSVVGITIYNSEGVKGYASGVVYSEDGFIITNDHIYENVTDAKFKIYDFEGNSYDANFIAGDSRSDLAVLKVTQDGFFSATFGNSDDVNFGEAVVAIGRPNSPTDNSSITRGIVSYPNRRVSNSTNYSSKLIQTDAAINPGSSGGALVNMYGQIIGITSSKLVGNSYEGVGYAIPTVTVKKIVESLIKNGKVVNRGRLGITYQDVSTVSVTENTISYGLRIVSISEDSDVYNKVVPGDIIISVNNNKVTSDDILIDVIDSSLPGDILNLEIVTKSGEKKQIKVKVLQDVGSSSYVTSQQDLPELPK